MEWYTILQWIVFWTIVYMIANHIIQNSGQLDTVNQELEYDKDFFNLSEQQIRALYKRHKNWNKLSDNQKMQLIDSNFDWYNEDMKY